MTIKKHIEKSVSSCEQNHNYVACQHCAMEPICLPVKAGNCHSITLTDNYLSKRISGKANTILFNKGDDMTAIYAVTSGTYKLIDHNNKKEEKILGFRFPGELIGEDALHPKKYLYNAIAIGKSSVCQVKVADLMACSATVPMLQLSLVDILTRQSYISQSEFQTFIAKKSAESLVSAFLLNIYKRRADHDNAVDTINLTISRDNIANFLGLRRETLSRIFSKFQKEQLLSIEAKQVHLLNKEKLTQLASQ